MLLCSDIFSYVFNFNEHEKYSNPTKVAAYFSKFSKIQHMDKQQLPNKLLSVLAMKMEVFYILFEISTCEIENEILIENNNLLSENTSIAFKIRNYFLNNLFHNSHFSKDSLLTAKICYNSLYSALHEEYELIVKTMRKLNLIDQELLKVFEYKISKCKSSIFKYKSIFDDLMEKRLKIQRTISNLEKYKNIIKTQNHLDKINHKMDESEQALRRNLSYLIFLRKIIATEGELKETLSQILGSK